jgi:hypothetical protein
MFGFDDILMIGASLLGAKSASDSSKATEKASDQNYQINKENLAFQKVAREEGIEVAKRLEAEGKLGVTDAYGNRVRFVPGKGWVTELSPLQQAIADLVQREQMRQGTIGADRAAETEGRLADDARQASVRDTEAGRAFDAIDAPRARPIAEMLAAAGETSRNAAADRAGERAATAIVRSGGGGDYASGQEARARADAEGSRAGGIDALLKAMEYEDSRYGGQRSDASELMQQFGQRASYQPNFNLTSPQGPQGGGDAAARGQQALSSATTMIPQGDYVTPDYSQAQQTAGLADIGAGLGTYFNNKKNNEMLLELLGAGGQR